MSMSHDEMVAVILAQKEGKAIQVVALDAYGMRWDAMQPIETFDFTRNLYREKPEPREWWIKLGHTGSTAYIADEVYGRANKFIHVREVMEDAP